MTAEPSAQYLAAFLDGLEFALLALEGRDTLTAENRRFIEDYRRIVAAHRARGTTPPPDVIHVLGRVLREADIAPTLRN